MTLAGTAAGMTLVACFRVQPQPLPPLLALPGIIPVYEIKPSSDTSPAVLSRSRTRDPLAQLTSSKLVTLASADADARTLLLWLAQQASLSLVISQDIHARISVNFRDAPVIDALRAVIAQAGLSVLVGDRTALWPPVVFYQLPVDIDKVGAATIAARFGISLELANWLVEARAKP